MSRSRRRTPIAGITCCESERSWKKIWHGKFRALARSRGIELTDPRLVSDDRSMGKDGKAVLTGWPNAERLMRK